MKLAELKKNVAELRDASRFRHGDPYTFSVPFMPLEVELPGPSDPAAYLSKLQAKTKIVIKGSRCLVVGAGNGGLCASLMNLGAKEVVATDGRDRFHAAMDEVIRLLSDLHEFNPLTYRSWPSTGVEKSLGEFDLIFFPEGLVECREPCETLETICRLLKADGRLLVEVHHGGQYVLKDPVNSFRPTEDAFSAMMKQITGVEPLLVLPGRASTRRIHVVTRSHQLGRAVTKTPAPLPAFPLDKPVKWALPPRHAPKVPEAPETHKSSLPSFPRDSAPAPTPPPEPPKTEVKTTEVKTETKSPSDPEKDSRLGHMLKGPPMTPAAQKRHDDAKKKGDWADSFQPPLDKIKDTDTTERPTKKTKKQPKKPKTSDKKKPSSEKSNSPES